MSFPEAGVTMVLARTAVLTLLHGGVIQAASAQSTDAPDITSPGAVT